uniref:Uncharacterized protein n=1 Tax=Meloidogyne enterolobii TaxID=390850 RepID=A0A6V7WPF5_MELEN|nr:unnamed protein product [Meloidogyne enterolobii]
MNGEGLSNCEAELKPSLSDYLKLQTKYIEEKEKSLNLEKKIFYLENGLKEKEKQNFQQLINEKMKEMNEKIQKIKSENNQKDEKINSLEKANDLFNKKIADLTNELGKLKNIQSLSFVKIENKWKEIDFTYNGNFKCCENECINTNNPIGNCCKGNGFVNLINEENIKYIKCWEGKGK